MTEYGALPRDLADLGWKLISRNGRLFAVSIEWGGTVVSEDIKTVITNARAMTQYIRWRMNKEAEQQDSNNASRIQNAYQ
jgi:hypothetical protein